MEKPWYIAFSQNGRSCSASTDSLEKLVGTWGLWFGGWPTRFYQVFGETKRERGVSPLSEVSETDVEEAVERWTKKWAGEWTEVMTRAQMAWRAVLSRPAISEERVEYSLNHALSARGMGHWELQKFESANRLEQAFISGVLRGEKEFTVTKATRLIEGFSDVSKLVVARSGVAVLSEEVTEPWEVPIGVGLRGLKGIAREVAEYFWKAWGPEGALLVYFEMLRGRVRGDYTMLDLGIRGAYESGMREALPIGEETLGWVMCPEGIDSTDGAS